VEKIVHRLSHRSYRILLRRWEGIDWTTIADESGIAVSTCQNSFWREVREAQLEMLTLPRRATSTKRSRPNAGEKERDPFAS
jgi:hypothetical protein